jgi:predicted transcriptional regulator
MDSLGSNREKAQNKLILLYIIDTISIPVSNLQVTKLILDKKFMNYFLLQQFLNELRESGLLSTEIMGDKTMYTITQSGKQTLEYFSSHIPTGMKDSIKNSLAALRTSIKNETHITSDF